MSTASATGPFVPADPAVTRPDLQGTHGMVASTHWIASTIAHSILEQGGNAFDAAAAGAFALHLVEPHLNGPGGDMTAVFTTADHPASPRVLMGQGAAPAGATIAHMRAEGLDRVPGAGALAAAIPGAVDAWLLLLAEHGSLDLDDVIAPAIDLAENGHPVLERVCRQIEAVTELFTRHWPSSAALWMPQGRAPRPGELIRNPDWAAVLRGMLEAADDADLPGGGAAVGTIGSAAEPDARCARIEAARTWWRTGPVAEAVEEFLRVPHRHSDGQDHAGVLTRTDLAAPVAQIEDACTLEVFGHTIAKTGAWGQGPMLLQALQILEGFAPEQVDPSTAGGAHRVIEALKLALADRDTRYGDPETGVDLEALLDQAYATQRRSLITESAEAGFRPGPSDLPLPPLVTDAEWQRLHGRTRDGAAGEPTVPGARGRSPRSEDARRAPTGSPVGTEQATGHDDSPAGPTGGPCPGGPAEGGAASADGEVRGDTCHIDVVDRFGNMISATPSGGWLQSSPTIPGLGFCLGTRLQMTWLEERSPSALTPGRRPRTTLSPTLVLRDGQPVMACGTPGGDQQDQWQLPFLLRVLVGGYTPQQAIDAPMLHTTAAPGSFWPRTWEPAGVVAEGRLGPDLLADLERRGHRVTRSGPWTLGRLSCVTRDPGTGVLGAAATSRGAQGYAVGR